MPQKLEKKLNEFEHTYNPQHFYCRLKDFKIPKKEAIQIMKKYEKTVYKEVIELIKKYR